MKAILVIMTIFLTIPANLVWAQNIQPDDTLTVQVLSPYSYKAEDGLTVVLGEVENKNSFPVTGVKLGVFFYDDVGQVREYKTGTTLLKVIPPQGKAIFSISSTEPDPTITDISVNLTGFNSSPSKQQVLNISSGTLNISDKLTLLGNVTNSGTIPANGIIIYLISYDAFERVVSIATTMPESSDLGVGMTSNFNINSTAHQNAKSYKIIAESDSSQSVLTDITDVKTSISTLTKLVTISETSVTDPDGNKYTTIPVGSPAKITSAIWIKYADDQSTEQPYVCYVQIKRVGGGVEFIGAAEGIFHGAEKQNASVAWIPESEGAFFIEVYVWDPNAVALASPSSDINVMLVK